MPIYRGESEHTHTQNPKDPWGQEREYDPSLVRQRQDTEEETSSPGSKP